MNRSDLQLLSETRVEDAEVLLRAGRWATAYHLLGYAVECGLKACAARHHVLHEQYGGVFAAMPTVAGTLFRERLGQYEYHHFPNSHATLSSQIIRGLSRGN